MQLRPGDILLATYQNAFNCMEIIVFIHSLWFNSTGPEEWINNNWLTENMWHAISRINCDPFHFRHYSDVIMSTMASQITSLTIVYWNIYSRRRSKKSPKLRVTGLCAGNSPVIDEFPAQRASNEENVFIQCRYHGTCITRLHRVKKNISKTIGGEATDSNTSIWKP